MGIINIHSFKAVGMEAVPITIETEITGGVGIHLIGLSDIGVKESLLRTVAALQSRGYHIPGQKININVTPADLCKSSSGYDLPMAVGIIAASGQKELPDIDKYVIAGELGLDSSVREITGYIQAAILAKKTGKACILPTESAKLAARALGEAVKIYGVNNLNEALDILAGGALESTALDDIDAQEDRKGFEEHILRWDDVPGHVAGKRALEIAAAGGHPILMVGAPGSGKATLAKILPQILPPMTQEEALEVQHIYSTAGKAIIPSVRPFRAPHNSLSMSALIGGGAGDAVMPGEVSLAHNGILFLDEFAEMPKAIKETLRGPMEDKKVTISRLKSRVEYPARFFPVLATNPCPCGYYGKGDRCTCTRGQRAAYLSHLQTPIMDKITLQVWVHPDIKPVPGKPVDNEDPCSVVAERVEKAREIQIKRQGKLNDELSATEIERLVAPDSEEIREAIRAFAGEIVNRLGLSVRAYTRIYKMARTIADLEESANVLPQHVAEAAAYRFLDRTIDYQQ